MNEEVKRAPNMTRHEQSQDKSAKSEGGGSASSSHSEIHDRTGLYISIIALAISCIISGMALMGYFWAYSEMQNAKMAAQAAKNRADAAMLRTEGFTRALIAHGIDPYPHLKGEDN